MVCQAPGTGPKVVGCR